MSTISDVARLAGVSTMTVSRVVNNSGPISPDTRARVEQAVAELGYLPNVLGRQLRSRRTETLALVLTDITNPFFTTVARGVEDVAGAHGFAVMFCNTDESEAEEIKYLHVLIQRRVDGILLVPAGSSDRSLQLLHRHRLPVVVLDRHLSAPGVDEVRTDSEAGAYMAVCHLLELGHRRIAVLTGPPAISTSSDRVAGYRRAHAEHGLEVDNRLVLYAGFSPADGFETTRQVLARESRPTALFAANNFIAFGAIQALREAGLRVPEDVSIVAFDDLPPAWVFDPFLTVISQPAYEIGRQAAELLLERLAHEAPAEARSIVLPGALIVRRSCGRPRSEAIQ